MKRNITTLIGTGAIAAAVLLGSVSHAATAHADTTSGAKTTVTKAPPPPPKLSGVQGESTDDKHSNLPI
jgi:hypothetical protein